MSGVYPVTFGFSAVDFRSIDPTLVSEAQSGRQFVRKLGAQQWRFTVRHPVLTENQWRELAAFRNKQRGQYEPFTIVLPLISQPMGAASGTPTATAAQAGATQVSTTGWTANIAEILRAGDKLVFAGHTKVYEVSETVSSSSTGTATLTLYPPLLKAVAAGEAVTCRDVPFTVRFAGPEQRYSLSAPDFCATDAEMLEVL